MKVICGILGSFLLMITACEKEVSDQLKGKWQLKTVEEAGVITQVDTVWYNFQSESLFMYQIYFPEIDSFLLQYGFKTQPEKHAIHLEFKKGWPNKDINYFLPLTDWNEETRTFSIEKVNSKNLVLKSDKKTYTFDKF